MTSRNLRAAWAAPLQLHEAPGFPLAPVDFTVTFPAGTYEIYSVHRDPRALGRLKVSIGNSIVVVALP